MVEAKDPATSALIRWALALADDPMGFEGWAAQPFLEAAAAYRAAHPEAMCDE